MHRRFISVLRFVLLAVVLASSALQPQSQVFAAGFSVTPITWNIIGLDSNNPNVGPNHFPIGARVCNDTGAVATNVTAKFVWDTGGTAAANEVYERPGTNTTLSVASLNSGACTDFYYEVEVSRALAPYDKTRLYHIEVTSTETGATKYSTPTPRVLYVEHLISQNRNWIPDVKFGTSEASLTSVPAGGTMTLMVGNTYFIRLEGQTATQGYEQIESFINIPNIIFQILSVKTDYSAESSPTMVPDELGTPDRYYELYGDACVWENDPNSPNYRSCLGIGKAGGLTNVTYQVKILQVPGAPLVNPQPLSTLIYDFSGSSFHYNADYGVSTRYAYILDPSAVTINKSFVPDTVTPASTSTVTIRIPNPTASTLTGVNFVDDLPDTSQVPAAPGNMVVASTPNLSYAGCNASSTPSPASLTAGTGSISFANISIPAGATCTIKFDVTVPTIGTYTNKTGNLFINTSLDTGNSATANLTVASNAPSCTTGVTLASWTVPTTATEPPDSTGGAPTTKAANVTTASALGNVVVSNLSIVSNPWTTGVWSMNKSPNTLVLGQDYFSFTVDTSKYKDIAWSFKAGKATDGSSDRFNLYYLPNGGSRTQIGAAPFGTLAANNTLYNYSNTFSGYFASGNTVFYIYPYNGPGGGNNDKFVIDDILFTGTTCAPPVPSITKSFGTDPIKVYSAATDVSQLTFTITNNSTPPPSPEALTGVKFSDTLPTGLTIVNNATYPATTTCTNGTVTAVDGTTTISLAGTSNGGASISAGGSCTVSVYVKGTTAGTYDNISGYVESAESGQNRGTSGFATDSITVVAPPTLTKSFGQSSVLVNGTSTMQFTIANPNTATALSNISFTDSGAGWPAGLTVTTSGPTSECGGSLSTTAPNILTFSGGSLAANASCTFSVTVTGTTAGTKSNTTSAITATAGGLSLTGNTSSATMTVNTPVSLLGLNKQISTDSTNWYKYVGVIPTQDVWYKFTLTNDGEADLTGISVNDPSYSLATCVPALPTTLAVGASASCVLGPISISSVPTPNPFINTATADSNETAPVTSTAKYGTKSLSIIKNATETFFTAAGNTLHYSYTVSNDGGYPLLGPVTVTDDKVGAVSCQDPTAVGDGDAYLDPGETVACPPTGTVSYTTSGTDVANKVVTNTAYGTAEGINSPSVNKSVPLAALTIDKDTTTSSVDINDNVVYTVVVVNTGQAALTNFQVSDVLPVFGGTSAVLSVSAPGYTVNGSYTGIAPNTNLLAGTDTFAAGATATITITVDLVNASAGTYQNSTTASTTQTGNVTDPGTDIDEDVTVTVRPDLTVTKTNNTANGWVTSGGTFQWTITARNGATAGTATFADGDTILTDVLPTGQTYGAVTVTNGATAPTGPISCSITGTTLSCAANGGPVSMPANASFNVSFNVTSTGNVNLPNTAAIDPGNKVVESNELNNAGSNTVYVFDAQPSKLLVTTSELFTSATRVAIGEMVRYRIAARIPEGVFANFELVDNIPSGLRFLDDGTARLALVSNGGGIASALTCTNDTGNAFDLASLTSTNVDCSLAGAISGGTGDGVAVTFNLGDVTNSDSDADAEYAVIEFNALVLNVNSALFPTINQGTDNLIGANVSNNRQNDTTLRVNSTTIGSNSANVTVNIAEPAITDVSKTVSAGPYAPGDAITYTLTFSNTTFGHTNAATAFDIELTDSLDANLTPGTVNVSSTQTDPCIGGTAFTSSNSTSGQDVTVNVSCLDPGKTVTVTIGATIKAATAGGTNISNTSNVTYTSLPGTQGSCSTSPFVCANVGGGGSGTGERNGSNGAGADISVLNNYTDSSTVSLTVTSTDTVPVATPDTNTAVEGGSAVTGNTITNDALGDIPTMVTAANQGGTPITIGTAFNTTAGGSLTLNANGTYSYTPPATLPEGGVLTEVFNYTITDVDGDTSSSTLTITVDRLPQANPDTDTATEGGAAVTGNTITNDDEGNPNATVTAANQGGTVITIGTAFPTAGGGSLTLNADGSYSYTPPAINLVPPAGLTEVFNYTITDADGDISSSTLTITVNDSDRLPVATNNSYTILAGSTASGNVMTDGTADTLGDPPTTVTSYDATSVNGGTVTVAANGSFTYNPNGYVGTDTFTYTITDTDGDPSTATVTIIVNQSLIGIAKRVVSKTEVSAGTWEIVYEFYVQNFGNVALSNLQVTDDLSATFPTPNTFSVQSLTSAAFTENGSYDGSTDINLLNGSDSLAAGANGTISLVVRVVPTTAGPFNNTAIASGQCPTCTTPVTDQSHDGTNPDGPDIDNDPTNDNDPTPLTFGPNLFDPPFGLKTYSDAGLPVLQWTMVWINGSNIVAINSQVSDPISAGTTYAGGLTCTASGVSATASCLFEAPSGTYPRGRIVWTGSIGPDLGATDAATANNEVTIIFNVTVNAGVTSVQNLATIDSDLDGNNVIAPSEQNVASATSAWSTQTQSTASRVLPATGFAPNVVTNMSNVAHEAYTATDGVTVEIPSLSVKIPVVGVPKKDGTWNVSWLANQAGWLEGTAFPSWNGNSVLTGHVYLSNGLPGPFVNLGTLKYGDKIVIHAYGQKYTFEVRENKIVEPNDKTVMKHEEKSWLTLVTCKEYDEKTNTYLKRVIVRAVLVNVTGE